MFHTAGWISRADTSDAKLCLFFYLNNDTEVCSRTTSFDQHFALLCCGLCAIASNRLKLAEWHCVVGAKAAVLPTIQPVLHQAHARYEEVAASVWPFSRWLGGVFSFLSPSPSMKHSHNTIPPFVARVLYIRSSGQTEQKKAIKSNKHLRGTAGIGCHSTSNIQPAGATALLSLIGFDRKGSALKMEKVTSDLTVKVHIGFTVWGFRGNFDIKQRGMRLIVFSFKWKLPEIVYLMAVWRTTLCSYTFYHSFT